MLQGEAFVLDLAHDGNFDVSKHLQPVPPELANLKSGLRAGGGSEVVSRALAEGKSAEEMLELLKSSNEEKEKPSAVAGRVCTALFKEVFSDKANPKVALLETYSSVLKHVAPTAELQVHVLLACHTAWHAVGSPKGVPLLLCTRAGVMQRGGFFKYERVRFRFFFFFFQLQFFFGTN